jgi:sulfofructose kinase
MWDVLGLGCATLDELLHVPTYPTADAKMEVTQRERRVGGLTAVALAAAARVSSRCAYAGVLGHDEISQFVETRLAEAGIDVSQVVRRDDAQPIYSTIIVEQEHDTRTILYSLLGKTGADDTRPTAEVIRASRALFIDDYGVQGNLRAAKIAREAGIPVVADFERDDTAQHEALLALVDHLILSSDYAMNITGTSHPADAARKLWVADRAAVIITGGTEGGWYLADETSEVQQYPAFPVSVVDTVGCGDVFHGVYAATLTQGMAMEARLRFASAAAALKAAQSGGIRGIPNREAVEAFLKSQDDE